MSTTMLKYLVMGIKQFIIKKKCRVCGLLIPSAWTYCNEHNQRPYKKKNKERKISPPRVVIYRFSDVLKVYKIHPSLNIHTIKNKEYLVSDENGVIVGYK